MAWLDERFSPAAGARKAKGWAVSVLVMSPFAFHPFNELAALRRFVPFSFVVFCRHFCIPKATNRLVVLRIKNREFSPKSGFLVPQNRNMSGDGCALPKADSG
jgi:hypothetical protein